jgi:hypothetical protein
MGHRLKAAQQVRGRLDEPRVTHLALASAMLLFAAAACARKAPGEGADPLHDAAAALSSAPRVVSAARPAPSQEPRVTIPAALKDTCRDICARSQQLKCKSSEQCAPNCIAMAALTPCSPQISALFSCILREPLAHWECAEDGVAAIRKGYCDAEQEQAVTCMEQKMTP